MAHKTVKKRTTKRAKKPRYLSAEKLQMLPEERKALIDFIRSPVLGRIVAVNGHAHYYDQSCSDDKAVAERNECGTAGCVAGYVLAHAQHVQGLKKLRGQGIPWDYIWTIATGAPRTPSKSNPASPLLEELYSRGANYKLSTTRGVVEGLLTKGEVNWPPFDGIDPRAEYTD